MPLAPTDADRAWWATQNDEGGEAEADRTAIESRTVSRLDWALDRIGEERQAEAWLEAGICMF